MIKNRENLLQYGIFILRVGIGITMMLHGIPKLLAGPETWTFLGSAMGNLGINFAPTFWGFMASVAEGVGGLMLVLGLMFRPTALMMAFNMFVGMLMHISQGDGFMGYGHALDLLIVFVALFFIGAGKYSLDKKFIPIIA